MTFSPKPVRRDAEIWTVVCAGCAASLFVASFFVPAYRWAFELTAVFLFTAAIYLFVRYSLRFDYTLEKSDIDGAPQLTVWKKNGKREPVPDARVLLRDMVCLEEVTRGRETGKILASFPEARLFRYTVSLKPGKTCLAVFRSETYGCVALLLEGEEIFLSLKALRTDPGEND